MFMDDVLLNKAASIERCLVRVREEYVGAESQLETNFTRQDAIVLNLLRAAENAIDAAMHVVRVERLGVPQQSRDAFGLLENSGLIDPELSRRMKAMVGFRNIAVHINPATLYVGLSRRMRACGKASKRRCSHSTASFDNAVRRRACGGPSFIINLLGAKRMARLCVAALGKGTPLACEPRLDTRHAPCPEADIYSGRVNKTLSRSERTEDSVRPWAAGVVCGAAQIPK